ncbi:hypothetical protein GCM10009753_73320 [Streptantibioticus ferralitis]
MGGYGQIDYSRLYAAVVQPAGRDGPCDDLALGFGDPFSDLFNRLFGMSPSASPPAVQRVPIGRLLSDSSHELLAAAGGRAAEDGAYLDTVHLLWAATQLPTSRQLLEHAGVDPDHLAESLEQTLPTGTGTGDGDPALTPAAKRALLAAHARSQAAGASHIGPEHILAALMDDPRAGFAGTLRSEGVSPGALSGAGPGAPGGGRDAAAGGHSDTPTLRVVRGLGSDHLCLYVLIAESMLAVSQLCWRGDGWRSRCCLCLRWSSILGCVEPVWRGRVQQLHAVAHPQTSAGSSACGVEGAAAMAQQLSPRQVARPSFTATAAMTRAATGSAQDQLRRESASRPTRSTADRYVHNRVCLESATAEAEPCSRPARRWAVDRAGMTMSERAASRIPESEWLVSAAPARARIASAVT